MKGQLCYWNPQRFFGIIESKVKDPLGWRVDKYFLRVSQIRFQTVEEVHIGCWVRFEVEQHPKPAKWPGILPSACSAQIFETLEQLQQFEKAESKAAL